MLTTQAVVPDGAGTAAPRAVAVSIKDEAADRLAGSGAGEVLMMAGLSGRQSAVSARHKPMT